MKTRLLAWFALVVVPVALAQEPADVQAEMQRASEEVAALLVAGREAGDEAVVECLGRRLASLRVLVEVGAATDAARRQALTAGRTDVADQKQVVMAQAHGMALALRAEADQCPAEEVHTAELPEWWPCPGRYSCEVETADLPVDADFGFDPPEASPFM